MSAQEERKPVRFTRELKQFLHYISLERGLAENTSSSYGNDLSRFSEFLQSLGMTSYTEATARTIQAFLAHPVMTEMAVSTRARYLYAIRGMYKYLHSTGAIAANISDGYWVTPDTIA